MDSKLLAVFFGGYIGPLSGNAVLAMIPVLKTEFSTGAEGILMSITFFMLPFAIFNLFSGTISDVYGRREVLNIGFLVYVAGGLICVFSPSLTVFFIGRSVQGIGYAFVNPVLLAVLGDMTAPQERGRVMGYFGAFTTAGIATGPMIAGFLIPYGWRWMFVLIVVLALGVNFWIWRSCRSSVRDPEALSDLRVNMMSALRTKGMVTLSALGFLAYLCYMGSLGFLSDHLSLPPLEMGEGTIGVLVGMSGVAGMVAAPLGGGLVDSKGRTFTAALGFAIVAVSMLLLYRSTGEITFAISLLVLGTGTAFIWASLLTITVEINCSIKGTVSSVFNSIRFMGYSLAPVVFSPIYSSSGFSAVLISGVLLSVASIFVVRSLKVQLMESQCDITSSS